MKKVLLFFFSLLLVAVSLYAENKIKLGYCHGALAAKECITIESAGWVDGGVLLPVELLEDYAGNSLTKIRVGLVSRINVDSVKVWVKNSLEEDNVAEGMLVFGQGQSIVRGWNEVTLDNPCVIKSDMPIFIGFSYYQKERARVFSAVGYPVDGAFFMRVDDGWSDVSCYGSLSVEGVVEGDNLPACNLSIVDAWVKNGGETNLDINVRVVNRGVLPVQGFSLLLEDKVFGNCDTRRIDQEILQNEVVDLNYSVNGKSLEEMNELTMFLAGINGEQDEAEQVDSCVVVKSCRRNVVLEEFTSESCGNCPAVNNLIHEVLEEIDFRDEVIFLSHHSGYVEDWLTSDLDRECVWFYNNGSSTYAPAVMFDRFPYFKNSKELETPVGFVSDSAEVKKYLRHRLNSFCPVELSIEGEYDNKESLKVRVTGVRSRRFCGSDIRLSVFLVEDGIKAKHQNGGGSEYLHDGVIRAWNQIWGESIDWQENGFDCECSLTVSPYWKRNKLYVVAFLSNYDMNNPNDCAVINAASRDFSMIVGVDELIQEKTIIKTEFYGSDGILISNVGNKGVYIQKTIYEDGSVDIRKVIL